MNHPFVFFTGAGLVAVAILIGSSRFTVPATKPAFAATAESRKPTRPRTHQTACPPVSEEIPASDAGTTPQDADETARHLADWRERLEHLANQLGGREQAIAALLAEIDTAFAGWANEQVTTLANLPPLERYDRLAEIETEVTDGAAAIIGQLGLDASLCATVAAGPLETIAAEIQYAEAAPDPASRLAMLRLDRERQTRLERALSLTDETAKAQAMIELDGWYDAGLGGIFATNETE